MKSHMVIIFYGFSPCFVYFCILFFNRFFSHQHVISEPFEPSPFIPSGTRTFDDELNIATTRQQRTQADEDALATLPVVEKENVARETNVAKIKVVVSFL